MPIDRRVRHNYYDIPSFTTARFRRKITSAIVLAFLLAKMLLMLEGYYN